MEEIQWRVELREPTDLTPDSTVELVLQYSNQNEYPHHIRSVFILPTWDLQDESIYTVDIKVSQEEVKELPTLEIETPQGLGGKQGFRVGAEVCGHDKEGKTDYEKMWGESIHRVNVENSPRYRSLVRISGNSEIIRSYGD